MKTKFTLTCCAKYVATSVPPFIFYNKYMYRVYISTNKGCLVQNDKKFVQSRFVSQIFCFRRFVNTYIALCKI